MVDLRRRLKKKRELNAKVGGKSLGELLQEEDANDWVSRMRNTGVQQQNLEAEKQKAAQRQKLLDEMVFN